MSPCSDQPSQSGLEKQAQAAQTTHENNPMKLAKISILLSTYNGQDYLAEQLDSFLAQTHLNWDVWASDDGSKDNTRALLATYQSKWPLERLFIVSGPARGFVANFLSLVCKEDIKADYYAFADQDDIWNADKLERAVAYLETIPQNIPALYCARTKLVDEQNNEIGLSPLFCKPPSFANALVQSLAGGNTMVFNNATRMLLREAGGDLSIITHDWWVYMVVMGCGGKVFYDPTPSLHYRQHSGNLVGMNVTWLAILRRILMLWQGKFRDWNNSNINALQCLSHRLTPENKEILERFIRARKMSLVPRLINLKRSHIYRQTFFGNLSLLFAAIFGKL